MQVTVLKGGFFWGGYIIICTEKNTLVLNNTRELQHPSSIMSCGILEASIGTQSHDIEHDFQSSLKPSFNTLLRSRSHSRTVENRKFACVQKENNSDFNILSCFQLVALADDQMVPGLFSELEYSFIQLYMFYTPPIAYGAIIAFQTDLHKLASGHLTLFVP